MLKCTSCGKEVTNDYVKFKCPSCGKNIIVRCNKCRKTNINYKCSECNFIGP